MVFILLHWSIGNGDEIVRLYANKDEAVAAAKAHAGPTHKIIDLSKPGQGHDKRIVFAINHPENWGGMRVETWEVHDAVAA